MRGNKQGKEGGVTISVATEGLKRGERRWKSAGTEAFMPVETSHCPLQMSRARGGGGAVAGRRKRRVGSSCLVFNVDVREERQ